MYQYRILKLIRITNSDTLTVEVDLGFKTRTEITFKVARVTVPDLDLYSDSDPQVEMRRAIIAWFKTSPRPWTVQMYKEAGAYSGDVIDNNGNLLNDDIMNPKASDKYETVIVDYGLPKATTSPS